MRRAVIFDLDGTLVDTIADIAAIMNSVLASFGYPARPVEEFRTLVGNGIVELARASLPETERNEGKVRLAGAAMMAAYTRTPVSFSRPYPGVEAILSRLAADGIPFAVLSNKPDSLVARIATALFPDARFAVLRGECPGVPRKPDPAAALDIAARLGVAPGDTVFVGDSDVDVMTARNAGMIPISVSWGYRPRGTLEAAGPAAIADTVAELERAIRVCYTQSRGE
ncbi:MAG: HAD-IA family hydrolase [Spirochaetes bacterium]|nr:HAD-IA family hydrolase [Spirochaetota bacterium]